MESSRASVCYCVVDVQYILCFVYRVAYDGKAVVDLGLV